MLLLLLVCASLFGSAQEHVKSDTLNIDLDEDLKKDLVIFDKENSKIVVQLSTQNFKPIRSKEIDFELVSSEIRPTKNGFEFSNNWMRADYVCQFRYNPTAKKIQLIGMSRYEFGPASNDGSGKSSINLLTNDYIGNWNYWVDEPGELIAMKTIKQKMVFPTTYLENFSDDIFYKFQDKCVSLYGYARAKIRKLHPIKN